ncbi:hypothetical protein EG68_06279 [Paragonimus skrjabini miyazakii]|uniref:G-protein coupled receptors family 1 profile domain-containing protein n=1 Tax=Paragonimus skrjabini miyazakii TaxID=59628 RepID=A0A8S9YQ84_9TREM|nr:hypothetical protein EG68_06279 [Paragonimus skrjabini miyazakii]
MSQLQTVKYLTSMAHGNASDYSNLVGAFRAYVCPFIATFGLLGNLFIVIVFSREQPRTRFSIYAISLAISNAITLITNTVLDDFLGRGLYYATNGEHHYKLDATSEFGCKFVEYLSNVMFFITSYIIVIFSLDRLLTIHRPIQFYSIHHKKWAVGACLLVYLIGFASNTPLIFIQTLVIDTASRTNFTCRMLEDHLVAKFSITYEVVCTYTIPFCLVLILNSSICFRLWQLRHERRRLLPADRVSNQLEMSRVMGHLALSTVFLLLYMPVVGLVLIRLHLTLTHVDRYTPYTLHVIDLSRLFSSIKDITYAINFPLYFAFLCNFRRRFLNMFSPCCTTETVTRYASSKSHGSRRTEKTTANTGLI